MPAEKAGVELGGEKGRMGGDLAQQIEIGLHAGDLVLRERGFEAPAGRMSIPVPHDQLGDHRVVMHRDGIALPYARVHADMPVFRRRAQMLERADDWACSPAPGPRRRAGPRWHVRRSRAGPALAAGARRRPRAAAIRPGPAR